MNIYIDISNYYKTRAHTGIQRVIREFLCRVKDNVNIYVVVFNPCTCDYAIMSSLQLKLFLDDPKSFDCNIDESLNINDISSGDIFFDIDAVWNLSINRNFLYERLKKNNVKIYNFIYDLVPIIKPEYSHKYTINNFVGYIDAVYKYSDMVFFDSRSAERDFNDIKEHIGNNRDISSRVIHLGADLPVFNGDGYISVEINKLINKKYLLFVGTIEPRKKQQLVLDAFDELSQRYDDLNLVFVGKQGWNNDRLIHDIKNKVHTTKRVFWFDNVSDLELDFLYKNCFISTYLSEYEGFGLPVAESLNYGNITISSKNSSMYEVGKDYCDYLRFNSHGELVGLISKYIDDAELYKKKRLYIKNGFSPFSWDAMYDSLIQAIINDKSDEFIHPVDRLQFVFISIDYHNLSGTLKLIDEYVPFVKQIIVITKRELVEKFKTLKTKHELIIINEDDILGEYLNGFDERDHVSKNWLLRTSLVKLDNLDDVFIMLDDDNRPLKKIDLDHFITNGKYNAYYFYDLLEWLPNKTDYDIGQHNMKSVLGNKGYELLSYSCHKPQVIDKRILKEVVKEFLDIGLNTAIDEWSIYFNYAVSKYPNLFNKKKFDTLNWPDKPSHWPLSYIPDEYNFENYYKSSYGKGLFSYDFTTEQKINFKNKQLSPYLYNIKLTSDYRDKVEFFDLVHSVLYFSYNNLKINLFSMPFYVKASTRSWLKLPINFKLIQSGHYEDNVDCFVTYYINGFQGHLTQLRFLHNNSGYAEGVFHFCISCEDLEPGEYDILIDAIVDGNPIYGHLSPYKVRLVVV